MKTLSGAIGFMMLFAVPEEPTWAAMGWYLVWLAAAIALLAYGGAFKQQTTKKQRYE